ncbi:hypothetical protein CISIN_1g0354841mg, partial [Citrus sinensis]
MLPFSSSQTIKSFLFNVEWKTVSRLCNTKLLLLTVNGEYSGLAIAVYEGDNVQIKVTNRVAQNTTIR